MRRTRFGKPYDVNADLPQDVRDALPSDAQTAYREAFNYADAEYDDWDEGRKHQYAWGAVKQTWEQDEDGDWVRKRGRSVAEWKRIVEGLLKAETQGRMGGTAEGPDGVCACPECGFEKTHETGEPCYEIDCPECGATMARKIEKNTKRAKTVEEARAMLKRRDPLRARWEAPARLAKAYEGEDGEMFLTIVASDTGPDRQGGMDPTTGKSWVAERISENFLAKMHAQAGEGIVELADGHDSGMPMGFVVGTAEVEGSDAPYPQFVPIVKIEPDSATGVQLWKAAMDGTYDRGFSIGGYIDASYVAHDTDAGGMVKWLDNGELTHIATCRPDEPANPRTSMVEAMAKALREAGDEPPVVADEAEKRMITTAMDDNFYLGPEDVVEALGEFADWSWNTDFTANIASIKTRMNLPIIERTFASTLDAINCDEEMSIDEKQAAASAAVQQYYSALRNLVEGGASEPVALRRDEPMDRDTMKALIKEALDEAVVTDEGAEDDDTDVVEQLADLTAEQRAKVACALLGTDELAKVFMALPGLEASSMSTVQTKLEESEMLTGTLELAKSMEQLGDRIAKALERMEKDEADSADEGGQEDEAEDEAEDDEADEAPQTVDPDELARAIATELAKAIAGEATDADEEQEGLDAEEAEEDDAETSEDEMEKGANPDGLRKAIESGRFKAGSILRDRVRNVDDDGNPTR